MGISAIISLAMLMLIIIPIGLEKIPQFMAIIDDYSFIITASRYTLIFASLLFSVCSLYYIIPNAKLKLLEVIPGAVLTVILWSISGYLLSKYIVYYRQLSIVYGSLGSIIVTLIFFYIVNMIFIIGAEFNYLTRKTND